MGFHWLVLSVFFIFDIRNYLGEIPRATNFQMLNGEIPHELHTASNPPAMLWIRKDPEAAVPLLVIRPEIVEETLHRLVIVKLQLP